MEEQAGGDPACSTRYWPTIIGGDPPVIGCYMHVFLFSTHDHDIFASHFMPVKLTSVFGDPA
jgi:hypothetical protein